jgi:hypothetical protein
MKNQNDLIISIVSVLIGVILTIVFIASAPTVTPPAAPATVDTEAPKLPAGDVAYANSLPGGTSTGPGGGGSATLGGRMGLGGGGPMGAGGPMGGGGRGGAAGGPPRSKMAGAGG